MEIRKTDRLRKAYPCNDISKKHIVLSIKKWYNENIAQIY